MEKPIHTKKLAVVSVPNMVRLWLLQTLLFAFHSKNVADTKKVRIACRRLLGDWSEDSSFKFEDLFPNGEGIEDSTQFQVSRSDLEAMIFAIEIALGLGTIKGVQAFRVLDVQEHLSDVLVAHKEAGGE